MNAPIHIVTQAEHFLRLDEYLRDKQPAFPLGIIRRAIEQGDVRVNGHARTSGWRVRKDDKITVNMDGYVGFAVESEHVPLDVLFEDEHIIAVNKPPGMLSHPSVKERKGSLLNALLGYFERRPDRKTSTMWPGLAHRLDRDTSGVLVVAKHESALEKLFAEFHDRRVEKTYQAILLGRPEPPTGRIDAPIGRHPALWPRWRVMAEGKPAVTEYRVLRAFEECSLVELAPLTGRTHQLRIHAAHIDHSIIGDQVYGRAAAKRFSERHPSSAIPRHFLHAARLDFKHPVTNQRLRLEARLPDDMQRFLEVMTFH